ncbi:ABC transporter permease [Lachnotalea sp. AF33-28]|uniref:ABC transporter permease n=1 Tax=Lachnotalea sp. AF33-28 TaxID=2292046 RepID=UPI001FA97287|nr:ABC transporter permease subunit [Lachnotalea sp. AF33-28]
MRKHWQFYLLIALPLIYIIVFCYIPMPGVLMAFERYSPSKGLLGSDWVGLQHFKQFFASPSSTRIIWNTLRIGLYSLIAGFPIPIILAVAVNEVANKRFKKSVQMITYAPYFISTVVLVGILAQITDPRLGVLNKIIELFGGDPINFMGNPKMFDHLYVWSGIWQGVGYNSVIYIAALAGVSKELQEAAVVDGASRWKRIWHVDLPSIRPQIIILLIFSVGNVLNIGYEKIYLMQNDLNIQTSEVISTFVYKVGLVNADYGFSTAVGLFNAVISIILLTTTNYIAKKTTDTGIW